MYLKIKVERYFKSNIKRGKILCVFTPLMYFDDYSEIM